MGQVTIYIDNEIEAKMKKAAKASQLSVSKWIANLVEDKIATEWPLEILKLPGTWKDDFPTLEQIRTEHGNDIQREPF